MYNILINKYFYKSIALFLISINSSYLCTILILMIMKNIEELKKEQSELKERLHEIVELMNSEEYFTLNETRRKMYINLKVAIEIHLRCLSTMVYENLDNPIVNIPDFSWIGTMMGMFAPSFNLPKTELKESDFEIKEDKNE